ncbi:siderophore-interacting protein [Chelativorans salis]|uniref:Siderophore-interacting protein n=1 Tax=Chelativorans salis TaxID=2978478 RepID=A0ABT2LJT6_9HYPH|nr:siderophore-interacting protein [Chelativorans sp. EGI FJ00035]MCT7374687.1 siderophore-interacting protein [Chelativorans sp. EGI FJ00035]
MSRSLPLHAETTIASASPLDVMAKLRDHFIEHGTVSGSDDRWSVEFDIGTVDAVADDGAMQFRVSAADATSLAYLQWGVVEHVCEFTPGKAPEIDWQGGIAPGAPLPYFREMRVLRAAQLTPRMRRLTLVGDDLQRFSHDGMHVRLLLAPEEGVRPVWPVMGADGRQAWPEGPRPVARVYTIRRIDVAAGEIDIDFVLHEGVETPGASFALEARCGDVVGMTGPGGGELGEADWYLLAGDETALPAIGRMLEEMPAGKQVVALIEVADDAERQELPTKADLDLRWLSREGRPAGTTTLLADAVRALPFLGDNTLVFVWTGCEHAAAREIRAYLRKERGLPRRDCLVAAYWRRGISGEVEGSD